MAPVLPPRDNSFVFCQATANPYLVVKVQYF